MAYIFMDESGDLGFDFRKKKTSKYFVIAFLFIGNKRPVEKIVKKVFQSFSKQQKKHHPGTLHCNKERPVTRLKVLRALNEKNVSVISIYLNKAKVYTRLKDEKQVLYNYVTNILLDRVYTKKLIPLDQPIHLIASRRETNKFFNENFKSYLKNKLYPHQKLQLDVQIKFPSDEKCLQVVDFVCWALFRKREYGDDSYWNVIKQKIAEQSPLFP